MPNEPIELLPETDVLRTLRSMSQQLELRTPEAAQFDPATFRKRAESLQPDEDLYEAQITGDPLKGHPRPSPRWLRLRWTAVPAIALSSALAAFGVFTWGIPGTDKATNMLNGNENGLETTLELKTQPPYYLKASESPLGICSVYEDPSETQRSYTELNGSGSSLLLERGTDWIRVSLGTSVAIQLAEGAKVTAVTFTDGREATLIEPMSRVNQNHVERVVQFLHRGMPVMVSASASIATRELIRLAETVTVSSPPENKDREPSMPEPAGFTSTLLRPEDLGSIYRITYQAEPCPEQAQFTLAAPYELSAYTPKGWEFSRLSRGSARPLASPITITRRGQNLPATVTTKSNGTFAQYTWNEGGYVFEVTTNGPTLEQALVFIDSLRQDGNALDAPDDAAPIGPPDTLAP
jgi:hypothetical protein